MFRKPRLLRISRSRSYKACFALTIVIFLLSMGCATTPRVEPLAGVPPDVPVRTVEMTAEKYHFTPSEVRVKKGTLVKLVIRSKDRKHGIGIERYGIKEVIPAKGKGAVTVQFYAREKGEYTFKCSVFCGLGHPWMKGRIVVE